MSKISVMLKAQNKSNEILKELRSSGGRWLPEPQGVISRWSVDPRDVAAWKVGV